MGHQNLTNQEPPFTLVNAINDPDDWAGCPDPITAARKVGQDLVRPKVVVAVVDGILHIAIGFPSDYHNQIGNAAFEYSVGMDWQKRATEYGGAELELDFSAGTVKISGRSSTLDGRGVLRAAEAAVIQKVRRLMNGQPNLTADRTVD